MKFCLALFFFSLAQLGFAGEEAPTDDRQRNAQVFVVHGYMASPEHHWFPWLQKTLASDGVHVAVLPMPQSDNPQAGAWDAVLRERIGEVDENTYFVAHSLGCITVLKYLSGLPEGKRIGGVILVSGFSEPLERLPKLNEFVEERYAPDKIIRMTNHRFVIAARDDKIVPYELSRSLSRELQATLITLDEGGHFMESDGFTELPVVHETLSEVFSRRAVGR